MTNERNLSVSRWKQILQIEDGAIIGMSSVLLLQQSEEMGVDSLQEVYQAAKSSQNHSEGP